MSCTQDQRIRVLRANQLQADGKARRRHAAWHRNSRLLSQVEGVRVWGPGLPSASGADTGGAQQGRAVGAALPLPRHAGDCRPDPGAGGVRRAIGSASGRRGPAAFMARRRLAAGSEGL